MALHEGGSTDLMEAYLKIIESRQDSTGAASQLPSPEMVSNLGQYFPSVVHQSGNTYYRNSSGLLSSIPQTPQTTGSPQTNSSKGTLGQPTYPGGTIFPAAPELHAIVPQ